MTPFVAKELQIWRFAWSKSPLAASVAVMFPAFLCLVGLNFLLLGALAPETIDDCIVHSGLLIRADYGYRTGRTCALRTPSGDEVSYSTGCPPSSFLGREITVWSHTEYLGLVWPYRGIYQIEVEGKKVLDFAVVKANLEKPTGRLIIGLPLLLVGCFFFFWIRSNIWRQLQRAMNMEIKEVRLEFQKSRR